MLKAFQIIILCLALIVVAAVKLGAANEQEEEPPLVDPSIVPQEDTDSTMPDADGGGMSEEKMQELMKQLGGGGGGAEDMFGGMGMGMGMGGMGGGGRRYTRDIPAVEEDIPHVQCQTCQELVKHVQSLIVERRNKMKKKKVTELEILEMLETVCDPLQGDGEWITQFDIVEKDDALVLENKGEQGHCEEECKTIVQACDNVVKEADSDIAELLYSGKPTAADKICSGSIKRLKGACGQPAIPIRADRVAGGDNFRPKSEIDIALAEAGKELRKKQEINPDFLNNEEL